MNPGIFVAMKRVDGRCLARGDALGAWLADHPEEDPCAVRFAAMMVGRVPFPSIAGNPPVDRTRPYFDARFKEQHGPS